MIKAFCGVGIGVVALILVFAKDVVVRVLRILDVLVNAGPVLDFGGDFPAFAQRVIALQEKIDGSLVGMKTLRSKLEAIHECE